MKFSVLRGIVLVAALLLSSVLFAQKPGGVRSTATPVPLPSSYTNTNINYVRTWQTDMPFSDTGAVISTTRKVREVKQTTQYLDGLGRPIQTVAKGISANGKNDHPDRILRTRVGKNGEAIVKYKKNGTAKVAIDGIEKGILKDGLNFQKNDNVIAVGGEGQPSVDGVKSFTLKLSEYIGKEIKGFSYSSDGSNDVTDMVLGKYIRNEFDKSYGSPQELVKKYGVNYSSNSILQEFHTHPNGELGATQSAPELSADVKSLQNDKPQIPNASFIILYRISGQVKPGEYNYTHEYILKKQ